MAVVRAIGPKKVAIDVVHDTRWALPFPRTGGALSANAQP